MLKALQGPAIGLLLATGVLAGSPAHAVLIQGDFSMVGFQQDNSVTGVNFSQAQTPDFFIGAASGGVSGLLGNFTGALTDVSFAAPGPIWSIGGFAFVANVFTFVNFALDCGDAASTTGGCLSFSASGTITAPGFDPTPSTFVYTGQEGPSTASFSATQSATWISAPGTLIHLGTALVGLGVMARGRRRRV